MAKINNYKNITQQKLTKITLLILCLWQLTFFIFAPKQAYMQGILESWYTSQGLVFYKDIVTAYLPFLKYVMYVFHSIFGYSLIPSVTLSPLISIATTLILFATSKKYLRGYLQLVPSIFFTVWYSYLGGNFFSITSFLGLLLLLTLYSYMSWWNNPNKIKSLTTGFLFGISILTLQIVSPFIMILFLGIFLECLKKKQYKQLAYVFMGMSIPFAATLIWAITNNALEDFIYWNLTYYFGGYPYGSLGKEKSAMLVFIAIHSPIILYASQKHSKIILYATAALALSFWFAVFHPMRFQISLPIISLLFGLSLAEKKIKTASFILGGALTLNLICILFLVIPFMRASISKNNSTKIVSEVYPNDPMYSAVNWVNQNTPTNSRIFVLGDTYFYISAKRLPANSRNTIGVEPIVFYPLKDFQQEIIENEPDYWVIDERIFLSYENWNQVAVTNTIKKLLLCQNEVQRIDYWVIYERGKITEACIEQ